jgi:very-short-patch-repair endonuclease
MSEYPYPLYDEKGKVNCQICGSPFLVISPKHLKKHNVLHADYVNRFPAAPLSNQEFAARGKYGKNKDMFIHPENEEPIGEGIFVDEPFVEEMDDVEKFMKTEMKNTDPMRAMKIKFRDHLRLYFSNIQMDYLIRQFGTDKNLKLEFITDYCDPVLKVVIQFPDTFWHNHDLCIDLNKTIKLEKYGWKVYRIKSDNPSFEKIDEVLKEY